MSEVELTRRKLEVARKELEALEASALEPVDIHGMLGSLGGGMDRRPVSLSLGSTKDIVNVLPRDVPKYDKTVQVVFKKEETPTESKFTTLLEGAAKRPLQAEDVFQGQLRQGASPLKAAAVALTDKAVSIADNLGDSNEPNILELKPIIRVMTKEEKSETLSDPDFISSISSASKKIEKSVTSRSFISDVLGGTSSKKMSDADGVSLGFTFSNGPALEGRTLRGVRASPSNESVCISWHGGRALPSPSDNEGCLAVWSTHLHTTPDVLLVAPSAVSHGSFVPGDPTLFLGGTAAGGILLWDTREQSRRPVIQTAFPKKGHSFEIVVVERRGRHSTKLVSLDQNGHMCTWDMTMLKQPVSALDVTTQYKNVIALCAEISPTDQNLLYVGTGHGNMVEVSMHDTSPTVTPVFNSLHEGPIFAVDFHPVLDGVPLHSSELILTAGLDWCTKLWNSKDLKSPLHTFDTLDYASDVKWSPTHTASFVSADCTGRLQFWDLQRDRERPVRTFKMEEGVNNLSYLHSGKHVLVSDLKGSIHLLNLPMELAASRNDDPQFMHKFKNS